MKKTILIALLTLAALMTTASVASAVPPFCPPLCIGR